METVIKKAMGDDEAVCRKNIEMLEQDGFSIKEYSDYNEFLGSTVKYGV